jgi:hypothetical protein
VWTAAKRLRAESERACDDLALACGAQAADYAEHLLDIVTSVRRDRTPVVALAMARATEFEGRMLAILDAERTRATPSRQSAALVGALAAVTFLVGAAAPVPTSAAPAPGGATATSTPAGEQAEAAQPSDAPSVGPFAPVGASAPRPVAALAEVPAPRARAVPSGIAAPATPVPPASPAAPAVRPSPTSPELGGPDAAAPDVARDVDALRARAAAAADDDTRAGLLAKVLRTDTSAALRRVAAWGLAEFAERPVASVALATALRGDRIAPVREMAAWALASGDDDTAGRDALASALRGDADPTVRATAAWALGQRGDRASADALTAALRDTSAAVRVRAVWALGRVEPQQAPPALIATLRDPDAKVRRLGAWALYQIEDPAAVPALQAALRAERDADLQVAYVRALASLGEKSVEALRDLLESPDARLRAVAVRALAGGHAVGPWPEPWPEPRPSP